ncbi:MAG: glycine cleavage system aminomethyltransferase GcvT [Sulfobacillus sp.]
MDQALKHTPLYDLHVEFGGRMVGFGGWEMPIQYTSILAEHQAVRQRAGLFDVSHMGEIEVQGPGAAELVDQLVTNWPSQLPPGGVLYTPMCHPDGGIVDDLLVYKLDDDRFLLVVNAGTTEKDVNWVTSQAKRLGSPATITDCSPQIAQLALQGPKAEAILAPLLTADLSALAFFHWLKVDDLFGHCALVSRTGYTGEDGFEIYLESTAADQVARALLRHGQSAGLQMVGLGARDSLRFEACLPLYGQEISDSITPLEAALGVFVKWDKAFIGKEALASAKEHGLSRRLVGLRLSQRAVPRHGYEVVANGQIVGQVTSGMIAPTVGQPVALALVPPELSQVGTQLAVRIREQDIAAEVVKRPFYRRDQR